MIQISVSSVVKVLLVLLLVMLLEGCNARYVIPNQHVDPAKNNRASFNQDFSQCREDWPEMGSGVHVRQWEECMYLKGWR